MMKYKCLSKIAVHLLLSMLLVVYGYAQGKTTDKHDDNNGQPYIKWISQYPARAVAEVKQNSFKKIYNFLVQKERESYLGRPIAIIAANPGSFWVLDQGAETIYKMEKNKLEKPHSIRKKEHYFNSLIGECALPGGAILFTDSRLNKVFLIEKDDKKLLQLNDTMHFEQPTGVAYNKVTDEVWVVETAAHRVSLFKRNGELIKRIGTRGNENGQFNFPTSICIDKAGDAYVVDAMNFRVQIFNKKGEFVSTFGEAGDASGSFARPKGIATDTYGHIYVADALFHAVQIFDRAGNFLYSFGQQGRGKGEFWMPAGLYIDDRNYVYVADSYNSRIQIFQLINGG